MVGVTTTHTGGGDELMASANDSFVNEEYEECINLNSQALEVISDRMRRSRCLTARSAAYIKQERYQDALNDANTAIAEDPQNPSAHLRKGTALFHLHRFREACTTLEDGRSLSDNPGPFNRWIRACEIQEPRIEAPPNSDSDLQIKREIERKMDEANQLFVNESYSEALEIYSGLPGMCWLVNESPGRVLLGRSACLLKLDNPEGALEAAEGALEELPNEPLCYMRRGISLFHLDRVIEAIESFEDGKRLASSAIPAIDNWLRKCDQYLVGNAPTQSIEREHGNCDEGVQHNTDQLFDALLGRANRLAEGGQSQAARELLVCAEKLQALPPRALLVRAKLSQGLGDIDDALRDVKAAAEGDRTLTEAHGIMGEILFGRNLFEEAEACFEVCRGQDESSSVWPRWIRKCHVEKEAYKFTSLEAVGETVRSTEASRNSSNIEYEWRENEEWVIIVIPAHSEVHKMPTTLIEERREAQIVWDLNGPVDASESDGQLCDGKVIITLRKASKALWGRVQDLEAIDSLVPPPVEDTDEGDGGGDVSDSESSTDEEEFYHGAFQGTVLDEKTRMPDEGTENSLPSS